MRRNNFDKSSTGVDIECLCFYDTDSSQRLFDENFKIIQHAGYRTFTKAYYSNNGNVPDHDSIKFKIKGSKEALKKYLIKEGYDESDLTETHGQDNEQELFGILSEWPSLLNYEDLNKYDLKDSGLEIVPDKTLIKVAIRGYSQGDYAEVFYCPDDLKEVWGNDPKENELQDIFTHYFYDAPIYAQFNINGTEYNYWDMPEYNEYEWEREKFIEYVSKESGIGKEELESLLPEHLDYN